MADARLAKARDTLPAGYQFGDAAPVTIQITQTNWISWALCRCGVELFDQESIDKHVCHIPWRFGSANA